MESFEKVLHCSIGMYHAINDQFLFLTRGVDGIAVGRRVTRGTVVGRKTDQPAQDDCRKRPQSTRPPAESSSDPAFKQKEGPRQRQPIPPLLPQNRLHPEFSVSAPPAIGSPPKCFAPKPV